MDRGQSTTTTRSLNYMYIKWLPSYSSFPIPTGEVIVDLQGGYHQHRLKILECLSEEVVSAIRICKWRYWFYHMYTYLAKLGREGAEFSNVLINRINYFKQVFNFLRDFQRARLPNLKIWLKMIWYVCSIKYMHWISYVYHAADTFTRRWHKKCISTEESVMLIR